MANKRQFAKGLVIEGLLGKKIVGKKATEETAYLNMECTTFVKSTAPLFVYKFEGTLEGVKYARNLFEEEIEAILNGDEEMLAKYVQAKEVKEEKKPVTVTEIDLTALSVDELKKLCKELGVKVVKGDNMITLVEKLDDLEDEVLVMETASKLGYGQTVVLSPYGHTTDEDGYIDMDKLTDDEYIVLADKIMREYLDSLSDKEIVELNKCLEGDNYAGLKLKGTEAHVDNVMEWDYPYVLLNLSRIKRGKHDSAHTDFNIFLLDRKLNNVFSHYQNQFTQRFVMSNFFKRTDNIDKMTAIGKILKLDKESDKEQMMYNMLLNEKMQNIIEALDKIGLKTELKDYLSEKKLENVYGKMLKKKVDAYWETEQPSITQTTDNELRYYEEAEKLQLYKRANTPNGVGKGITFDLDGMSKKDALTLAGTILEALNTVIKAEEVEDIVATLKVME